MSAKKAPETFTSQQCKDLLAIAWEAGLPKDQTPAFRDWLTGLALIAKHTPSFEDVRTLQQQKEAYDRAICALREAQNKLEATGPTHYLLSHYLGRAHEDFCRNDLLFTQAAQKDVQFAFFDDIGALERIVELLVSASERAANAEPNEDERSRMQNAARPAETNILECVLNAWERAFHCRASFGKSSPLVRFCVELFRALGLGEGPSDPHEAMRKRLGALRKKKCNDR